MKYTKDNKKCTICSTLYFKRYTQAWSEWRNSQCCSRTCVGILKKRKYNKINKDQGRSYTKKCKTCSVSFKKKTNTPWSDWDETVKYCSRKCWNKSKKISVLAKARQTPEMRLKASLARRGKKSHRWKGGVTRLQKLVRNNNKYIHWRNTVFKRDNFTCQHCQTRGGDLEVDHIIEYHRIIKAFKIKTIDQAIDNFLLWETANGRTLCKPCHIKRHNRMV